MKIPKHIQKSMQSYPPFYVKVWKECAKIPTGKTITYSELAKRIGNPNASRAVGTALSKNPFAPIIPCHRVIRKDGQMGGYSMKGSVKLKEKILQYEKDAKKAFKSIKDLKA
ncbi:MAG: MGMT family protein [Elusimicrobiota bacterium]|jgi:O-6-methylguanine DNA methyltransferase|nr:MGMT family protein [Elusimicrobiota bacterium]